MAGQPGSRFFFKNSSLFRQVLPRVEMRLQSCLSSYSRQYIISSGVVAVVEVSKRTQGYSETFRTAAAKKNKQQRRNAAVQHPSTAALLRDCSLSLCDTVIPDKLLSHFSFFLHFCVPLLLPPELLAVCSTAALSSTSSGIVGHSL